MTRIAPLAAAGALLLAVVPTASAQFQARVGNSAWNYGYGFNRGYAGASVGAFNYGYGFGGPRVFVGTPAPAAVASPYAGYTTTGYTAITPLGGVVAGAPPTTWYSSGYSGGFGAPGTIIQQSYTTYPLNSFGAGASGLSSPTYGIVPGYGGGLNLNRVFGMPLR
ncbi:hypothetical protein [Tautonia sociabilis]|uniref:Uncharacterized protein n=1 Tax=Tautonia sociabilis TaxID=2080755 RepID=A0A432MNK0_9BACT|nr:hypothetical protein [Tautonia sociabilis]RUL88686.1 hypothetical protein TsocGM_05985 [Tautonia sociabilis]